MHVDDDQAARARTGDPDAQFALARTMLAASDATHQQMIEAVRLVDAAAASGHADATTLRALFEAMAVGRPQSWNHAFDSLELAAERGSVAARRQLLLLAEPAHDPDVPESPSPNLWAEKRRSISLERLLGDRPRRTISNEPRLRVIEGFASPAECRWLIDRGRAMLKAALVVDAQGRQVVDPSRSNRGAAFQLLDMDVVIEAIRARIAAAIRIPLPLFEPTQLLHYSVGQEFRSHHDYLDPSNPDHLVQLRSHGQRIATFLIYLNGDFEGGETEFPKAGLRYRGMMGDAIFWPNLDMEGQPDPGTIHAGLPPTSGEKWILSQWIRDRAPPPA